MASPQVENGYIRIASEIMEALCRFRIPGECRQVLDCIIRKTYGYHKKEDWISNSQMVEMTGMKKQNVSRALAKLMTNNVVIKSDDKLRLNKDYKEWGSFKSSSKVITGKNNSLSSKVIKPVIKLATAVIKSDDKLSSKVMDTIDNKDNTTINNITKDTSLRDGKTFGNPDINELIKYFPIRMQIPKEDCSQRQSRQYWNLLLKESRTGIDGVKWLIDLASQDDFYKSNITSSKDLYYKRVKIISRKRGEHDNSRISIDINKI